MAKADPDHAPPSLPDEYEALLKLTNGLHTLDLLKLDICEVGGVMIDHKEYFDEVPDLEDLREYMDLEVSAGFVLGLDHESTCNYVYCRNTGDDADEHEREWAWRVSFDSACHDTKDPYIGDFAGFLRYYPNIYKPDMIPEYVGYRLRDIHDLARGIWSHNHPSVFDEYEYE